MRGQNSASTNPACCFLSRRNNLLYRQIWSGNTAQRPLFILYASHWFLSYIHSKLPTPIGPLCYSHLLRPLDFKLILRFLIVSLSIDLIEKIYNLRLVGNHWSVWKQAGCPAGGRQKSKALCVLAPTPHLCLSCVCCPIRRALAPHGSQSPAWTVHGRDDRFITIWC